MHFPAAPSGCFYAFEFAEMKLRLRVSFLFFLFFFFSLTQVSPAGVGKPLGGFFQGFLPLPQRGGKGGQELGRGSHGPRRAASCPPACRPALRWHRTAASGERERRSRAGSAGPNPGPGPGPAGPGPGPPRTLQPPATSRPGRSAPGGSSPLAPGPRKCPAGPREQRETGEGRGAPGGSGRRRAGGSAAGLPPRRAAGTPAGPRWGRGGQDQAGSHPLPFLPGGQRRNNRHPLPGSLFSPRLPKYRRRAGCAWGSWCWLPDTICIFY